MSTEIVQWRPPTEELVKALTTPGYRLEAPDEMMPDAEAVQAAISARVLALDPDAALTAAATAGPLDGTDLIGIPIEITDGIVMPSTNQGPGFYYLLAFRRLDTGEEGMVSSGANTVMSQLAKRVGDGGPWPTPPVVWCQRDKPTPSGGRPEWLEPASTPSAGA